MSEVMQGFPSSQPNQVTLSNWRTAPYCHWAFHHVREIVPSAEIQNNPVDVWLLNSSSLNTDKIGLDEAIIQTDTDALVILHNDEIVHETYRNGMTASDPHILMSVSKSMLGLVAGTLIERNEIKEDDLIISVDLLDEFTQFVIFDASGPLFIKRLASIKNYPSIEEMKNIKGGNIGKNKNSKKNKNEEKYNSLSKLDLKILIREINESFYAFLNENK